MSQFKKSKSREDVVNKIAYSIWHEENNSEKFLPIEPVKSLSYDLVDYYIATNEIHYESFESLTEHSNEDFDLTQFRFN